MKKGKVDEERESW